jgi:hypothetical protein
MPGVQGTIRTGPGLFGPMYPGEPGMDAVNATAAYPYVDTLLLVNVNRLCRPLAGGAASLSSPAPPAATTTPPAPSSSLCSLLSDQLALQRAAYPGRKWDDPANARVSQWP